MKYAKRRTINRTYAKVGRIGRSSSLSLKQRRKAHNRVMKAHKKRMKKFK